MKLIAIETTALRHRIRGRIASVFLDAHAITPNDAIAFTPRSGVEARRFAALLRSGVVREHRPGHFHYHLATHYARIETRRRWSVPAAIIVAVALAGIATLFYKG